MSQRQYIRLLLADTINRFGDSIDVIAYSWIMYEIAGSASLMALVVGLNFVPTVFLTPFAGAFVDRISKKRVMALADLLRFVFVAAIVTLYTTGLLSPALIVVFTLATSTVEAFRLPAGGAILPQLLEQEYYTLGKAANYSVSRISGLAGYMLAGGVIALLGAAGALWIDAATFLISSAINMVDTVSGEPAGRKTDGKRCDSGFCGGLSLYPCKQDNPDGEPDRAADQLRHHAVDRFSDAVCIRLSENGA